MSTIGIATQIMKDYPLAYSIQHHVIKFVSDLQQVPAWFSPFSSTNKTDRNNINIIESAKHHNPNYLNPLKIRKSL
jgi:hypothetical protein